MRSSASLISSETRFICASSVRGVFAGSFAPRDLLAGLVALGLHALGGGDALAALLIECAEGGEINGHAAVRRHLLEFIQMFAEISKFMHVGRIA